MTMSSEIAGAIEEDEDMFDQDLKGAEGVQVNAIEPSRIPKFSVNGAKSPNADLTLSQRMLSACAGSLLTSLVVTPFDVVRIRLQQQELLYPVQSEGTTCCRKVFWENQPNEKPMGSIKGNFCQPNTCFQEGDKISGTFQGIKKISSQEGFTTLYRGLGLTLVMAIPANVVYFSGYEFLRDSSPFKQSNPVLNPLMCGSIARVLAATSVAPLECPICPFTNRCIGCIHEKEFGALFIGGLFCFLCFLLRWPIAEKGQFQWPSRVIYWGSYTSICWLC